EDLHLGHEAIAAALLWPALESEANAARRVRDKFGATICGLAEGTSRMSAMGALSSQRVSHQKPDEQAAQFEALRKMLLAMVQDVRVVLIKLADHTQDLRYAVKSTDAATRLETAQLTRDIFAPLANRLGVWHLKWELEDLAFRILEPDTYKEIARLLDDKRVNRQTYIENVLALLKDELARADIKAEVMGRPKHIYSIYNKMRRKGAEFEALYDVRAVRVLVDDVKDCYAVLGLVHNLWSPIPKEFDDYIAKPKANNYRSLHTAVIGPEGKSVEIQIRTHDMHQSSELGVAAHWRYKEGGRQNKGYDEKIAWLRQVLDWKDDVREGTGNISELAEQFRIGLFDDTIYVFTPQGKVVDLPKGSTPIDFAYHVHTELGHRCRGAKVDGAMVPLNTELHNGQQVEVTTATQGGPSRDWLNPQLGFIKSQGARGKVRQWFNRQNHDKDVAQGRTLLEKELQRHGLTALNLDKLAEGEGYAKLDDFLADIARGDVGPKRLQDALRPAPATEPPAETMPAPRKARANSGGGVLVVGIDKLLTVPAKCCKPAPPEPIVGFVSRGRGVTVHRASCVNVKRLDADRIVTAEWGAASGATFPVEMEIEALDRTGLLRDISEVFTRERANVIATNTLTRDMLARMRFTLEITDLEQLNRVLKTVRGVKGVMRAGRR
ncbi:MAG TPA: bifunctional (p)ppGpp synthetase/guanosine-3',5'-bis(diphosphate) 3'-pyrophosphohydrolase, partial [Burkholderiales bacterium]|nr:bifunctional (p)ppGpp synthetase/guanosine-3',5'-bis(diphosphate) 3'-pyrophosphohydrolase [Burkholderiales bacterium]